MPEHLIRFVIRAEHKTTRKFEKFSGRNDPFEKPEDVLRRFVAWYNQEFDTDFFLKEASDIEPDWR